jgi:AraC-like DNA-binding protein
MNQRFSTALVPVPSSSLSLTAVWDVRAYDSSYDVKRMQLEQRCIVAVRTFSGKGRLQRHSGTRFDMGPGSLLLVEDQQIARYRREEGDWHFWWFVFTVLGPLQFPLNRMVGVRDDPADHDEFEQLLTELRHGRSINRSLASARLALMLTRWLAQWEGKQVPHRHQRAIETAIERMHENIECNWTVRDMAREANMGERSFRKVFGEVTGQGPKRFYDRLRMEAAAELLKHGNRNVAEVSDLLGFSSPFHLSKVFRRHHGIPPSALKP